MAHSLIIDKNEEYNFLKVTCSEGHYLTNWDKKEIKEYHATKLMYCPINTNLGEYYCLTDAQHDEYIKQQEQAIKEEEENRNKLS